ncbi:MAG: RNA polymerase sporulation sigma factor SigH [Firmicutes bacterium]|nr:RNA polymerase sporulation sigma factor SigH [Bacillota bacterium]
MAIENLLILTDEQLAVMAREGSETAEELLIDKYKGLVKVKARAYFIAGGDQEDVVQEGMIGLMKAVRSFDPEREASFKTYASTCINNQIIKAIRNADRSKNQPLNEAVSLNDTVGNPESELTIEDIVRASIFDEPEQILLYEEMIERITKGIDANFSKLEREVLVRKLDGKSYIQIAKELGKSPKTIDNAIQRVRRKIENMLDS